ncbi:MAG: tripartite tricarboxylate transporter TctB family protein [Desulfovibrionaceae bacterium]
MPRRFVELLFLFGFLALAVLLYRSTAGYPSFVQESTAVYVRFLAWTLGILCGVDLLLGVLRHRGEDAGRKLEIAKSPQRFWALLILLCAYSWALDPLGFFPASIVFLPLTMLAMGYRRPLPIACTSAGILLFVYFVFAKLLEVHLPKGTLL